MARSFCISAGLDKLETPLDFKKKRGQLGLANGEGFLDEVTPEGTRNRRNQLSRTQGPLWDLRQCQGIWRMGLDWGWEVEEMTFPGRAAAGAGGTLSEWEVGVGEVL